MIRHLLVLWKIIASITLAALVIPESASAQGSFNPAPRASLDPETFQTVRRELNKRLEEMRTKLLTAGTRNEKSEIVISTRGNIANGFEAYASDYLFRSIVEDYKIRIMALSTNRCTSADPIPRKAATLSSMSPEDRRTFQFDKLLYDAYCQGIGDNYAGLPDTDNPYGTSTPLSMPPQQQQSQPQRFNTFSSYDLEGTLVSQFGTADPGLCENACRNDGVCMGYTYDRWNRRCYLKSNVRLLYKNARGLSGIDTRLAPRFSQARVYYEYFNNRAFAGEGRERMKASSRDICQKTCDATSWCSAFRFQTSGGTCSLYENAPEYFSQNGIYSGAKVQDPSN